MKKNKGAKAIAEVARQHWISEDEVRKEIQIAIDIAMAIPDASIQIYWAEVPCKGEKPTPEEAILYLSQKIKNKKH